MWKNKNGIQPFWPSCKRCVLRSAVRKSWSLLLNLTICVASGPLIVEPDAIKTPKLKRTATRTEWRIQSPRGAETLVEPMVTPHAPPSQLFWEYPLPLPRDVMFDILRAPTPDGPWQKIGEIDKPPFPITQEGFYRTNTRNL